MLKPRVLFFGLEVCTKRKLSSLSTSLSLYLSFLLSFECTKFFPSLSSVSLWKEESKREEEDETERRYNQGKRVERQQQCLPNPQTTLLHDFFTLEFFLSLEFFISSSVSQFKRFLILSFLSSSYRYLLLHPKA